MHYNTAVEPIYNHWYGLLTVEYKLSVQHSVNHELQCRLTERPDSWPGHRRPGMRNHLIMAGPSCNGRVVDDSDDTGNHWHSAGTGTGIAGGVTDSRLEAGGTATAVARPAVPSGQCRDGSVTDCMPASSSP